MLKDIRKITTHLFDAFGPENKPLSSPKACYDVYRKLEKLVYCTHLVAEHYLVQDFSEEYLQNSSYGSPQNKWRTVLNGDLEKLNKAAKAYLLELMHLSLEDSIWSFDSLLSRKYNMKFFYAFARDEYNVGFVDPCGFSMISTTINTKAPDNETIHIKKFQKTSLETLEDRVALQQTLREQKQLLEQELARLKAYMLKNYTLEMLVQNTRTFW
ncbi:MAG: hypothetical protein IBX45_08805 [Campylobacterales bacterium]|nr:hypothetical protein [Campylobacterales bacterium]